MNLSERKKKILQYVVDDYISTAQPVSSKSITEKYMKDVSSATVRSELAGLEELGFLNQPHTSSGRVPSIDAYRLYVTELMDKSKLSQKELVQIKDAFKEHSDNLEDVVTGAVKVISQLTDYTSVAYASRNKRDKIVKIDIFRYRKGQALLLVVTDTMLIRDKFIDVPENMSDGQITEAVKLINKLCVGKQLCDLKGVDKLISEEFDGYREIFDGVITAIEEYIDKDKPDVIMEGEGKILQNPEYTDSEKVKNFLSVVTSKDNLIDLLKEDNDNIEINIKIGGEEGAEALSDCSLVTATYSARGINIGTYGVIGPRRMDYQKVVSVLEGVGKILEDLIKTKKE